MTNHDALETIGSVAALIPPVPPGMRCEDVDRIFAADPDLGALAVVDRGRPMGLINRYDLITHLSRDYGRALYAKKPVADLMDASPLVVERRLTVDRLEALIADEHPSALLRGFIVTADGRYFGVATALSLLRLGMLRSERRNASLDRARQVAEAASLSKTRFLATMSHELRTPLNAIIGFAEVIGGEMLGPLQNERYREYIGDILQSGQHLLGLINNILDMAKIENGGWPIHPAVIDPREAVASCLRTLQARADRQRLTIETPVATAEPQEGYADPQALRHILQNLLSNAVKFTPPGGTIRIGLDFAADGGFCVSVRDTGIGIAPGDMALVMTPFGQVENDLTRKYDGTGLGLPLVKALTELHGGRFELKSVVGQGTEAEVHFPGRPNSLSQAAAPPAAA